MEVWSKIKFVMPTEKDYKLMSSLAERIFIDEEAYPWVAEQYNAEEKTIEIEQVIAIEDDVVEMVTLIHKWIAKLPPSDHKEILMGLTFKVEGTTEYYSSGEQTDYIIERNNGEITIQETGYYGMYHFDNYDGFCETVEEHGIHPQEAVSKEDFDPIFEYTISYNGVYVNDTPPYGPKYPIISKYKRAGEVQEIGDENFIAYFEENGIPYDNETIENLSVDDLYAILARAYRKYG